MSKEMNTLYDYMRRAENIEEDAMYPEEWLDDETLSDKEKYFDFYDDIKTTPKDDW